MMFPAPHWRVEFCFLEKDFFHVRASAIFTGKGSLKEVQSSFSEGPLIFPLLFSASRLFHIYHLLLDCMFAGYLQRFWNFFFLSLSSRSMWDFTSAAAACARGPRGGRRRTGGRTRRQKLSDAQAYQDNLAAISEKSA